MQIYFKNGSKYEVLNLIAAAVQNLCRKIRVPEAEAAEYISKVRKRDMGYLFEDKESVIHEISREFGLDVLEARKKAAQCWEQEKNCFDL